MPEAYRIHLRIERLENDQYLATSQTVPGLVAQGRTVTETVEIAQDVARKLIVSCLEHGGSRAGGPACNRCRHRRNGRCGGRLMGGLLET